MLKLLTPKGPQVPRLLFHLPGSNSHLVQGSKLVVEAVHLSVHRLDCGLHLQRLEML